MRVPTREYILEKYSRYFPPDVLLFPNTSCLGGFSKKAAWGPRMACRDCQQDCKRSFECESPRAKLIKSCSLDGTLYIGGRIVSGTPKEAIVLTVGTKILHDIGVP